MGKLKRNVGAYMVKFRGMGLNPGEVAIIECIRKFWDENCKYPMPSQISNDLKISQPTITPIINKMEEKGIIVKHTDKMDRRVRYISVTDKGFKMWQSNFKEHKQDVEGFINYLGEEDAQKLIYVLGKANEYFTLLYEQQEKKTTEEHE